MTHSPAALRVLWHDLECGGYGEDLPLWRALAEREVGPGPGRRRAGSRARAILDVGAGTGRVALDLARRGHEVVALDRDPDLLAALEERAGETAVTTVSTGEPAITTVCADARAFALDRRFGLVLVPMQTVQLLGGPSGRAAFLRCAREHLAPGGLLAVALADALEGFDADHVRPPPPDLREVAGVVYASRPVAVRDEGERVAIERIRETVDLAGHRTTSGDVVRLDRLSAGELAAEAAAHGLRALAPRSVPATDEFVGSTVVMLRG